MAFAPLLPLISGAVAAVGALAQGAQQAGQYRAEARAADYRATIAENNAVAVGQQTSAEEERVRRESRAVLAEQRAAIAQSGTGFGGSAQDVMRQSATYAELDALNIQYEGTAQRTGLLNEAGAERYNARNARVNAKSAMRQRWLSAAGGAIGAYGGAGGKSYLGKQVGAG